MGTNTVLLLRALSGIARSGIDAFASQGQQQQQGRGSRRKQKKEPCTPCAAKAEARAALQQARRR